MSKRRDPVDDFDSALIRLAKAFACVVGLFFAGLFYFRVLIPGVWEAGDIGKVAAVGLFCTFVILFAFIIVAVRRILFPTPIEEPTVEEDSDSDNHRPDQP